MKRREPALPASRLAEAIRNATLKTNVYACAAVARELCARLREHPGFDAKAFYDACDLDPEGRPF